MTLIRRKEFQAFRQWAVEAFWPEFPPDGAWEAWLARAEEEQRRKGSQS